MSELGLNPQLALGAIIRVAVLAVAAYLAYDIRLYAVKEYGRIIHEFDPWFNYRATEYLAEHGWFKFCNWFDYMSWYPLGRPVVRRKCRLTSG